VGPFILEQDQVSLELANLRKSGRRKLMKRTLSYDSSFARASSA
jgi:hypothetical protein